MSSWFGNRSSSSSNVPAASSVNKQKHKQIEHLRELVPGVVEVRRDELYRVDLTAGSNLITLEISLPQAFPLSNHSPLVTVSPPMRHPWINDEMIVDGSPLIQNFGINSNLGRAVQQIIKIFTEDPPVPVSSSSPYPPTAVSAGSSMFYVPVQSIPSPSVYSSVPHTIANDATRGPLPPPPAAAPTRSRYQPPAIPDQLEGIGQMSTEELERYLGENEGPVLVDQYVAKMDVIKKVCSDRDNLFADNESDAGFNLRFEPEMQESWTQLQHKFLEMQTLKSEYDTLLEEQKQLTERYQVRNVLAHLKTLVQDAETESEIIAEDFLDNKHTLAEFIQKYKHQRTLHHERKSKLEKLSSSRRDPR